LRRAPKISVGAERTTGDSVGMKVDEGAEEENRRGSEIPALEFVYA
jgi:hypothetical protein